MAWRGKDFVPEALSTGNEVLSDQIAYIPGFSGRVFDRIKLLVLSGGNFYATARKRISPTFAAYVHQAVKQNALLYRDADKLTGLKGDTFATFMEQNY